MTMTIRPIPAMGLILFLFALPLAAPASIQERAYTSPTGYTPGA
jgi:hypothetical protein